MWKIRSFRVTAPYRLWVEFADGVRGEVDLSADLWGPLGEPLRDQAVFALVELDEFGALAWPNGFDVAPDALHAELAAGGAVAGTVG
jgi:hypothetical protein